MGYKPKNFILQELIDPWTFKTYGIRGWTFLDARAVEMLQLIRDRHGPCRVNDWWKHGVRLASGFRPPQSRVGAKLSQHRFGRAFDVKPLQASVTDVREDIMDNPEVYKYITRLEHEDAAPAWVHFDCAATEHNGIWVFKP